MRFSAGRLGPMEMDQRQVEETFLIAAQSLFAVAILANLSFYSDGSDRYILLFATQLLVPDPAFRYYYSIFYVGLAVVLVAGKKDTRDGVFGLFSRGAAKPWRRLKRLAYR